MIQTIARFALFTLSFTACGMFLAACVWTCVDSFTHALARKQDKKEGTRND